MRLVLWVGVIGCAMMASGTAAAESVRVFVLAGQSNMEGRGDGTLLDPELAEQPEIWFDHHNPEARDGGSYAGSTSTDWEPLAPMGDNERYGPEITFAPRMLEAFPGDRIAIVKMSVGGSNIIEHWGRGLPPDPDGNTYKSQLYHALLGALDTAEYTGDNALAYPDEPTRLDRALARLADAGHDYTIAGFLWMQGENEASWSAAFQYDTLLSDFVAAIRADLGIADLPVVIGRVSDNLYAENGGPVAPDRSDNVTAVRTAQVAWADADPNARWVDTDDFVATDGGWHFDSAGYQTLGERMADAILEMIPASADTDAGVGPTDGGPGTGAGDAGVDSENGGGCCRVGGARDSLPAAVVVAVLLGLRRRRRRLP